MAISEKQKKELVNAIFGGNDSVHIADVVRHGDKIILPEKMDIDDAIVSLQRKSKYENEKVSMTYDFEYFVWDGAYALAMVMEEKFGFVFGKTIQSFFGDNPPALIGVNINGKDIVQVPWGHFTVPSIPQGVFQCGYKITEGKMNFQFSCVCKRKYQQEVNELRDGVQKFLETKSIYKGKAISIRFTDDKGRPLIENEEIPTPKFMDVSKNKESELVFPKEVDDAIRTNLFTPIDRMEEARALGVPIKRGILLAGDFGVGKTLTAYIAAGKAVKKGITYIYCMKPQEFVHVMRFAAQYAPALVFCEDVDRIVPGERDKNVDELINVIDGVETKNQEIITVFTTNEVKNVNQALLRPGRMDAVIHVKRPDAEAVQRLVRIYCGQYISPDADLTKVGKLLNDSIPAIIREVCERSKLSALRLLKEGDKFTTVPVEALIEASTTMKMQLDLLNKQHETPLSIEEKAGKFIGDGLLAVAKAIEGQHESFDDLSKMVDQDDSRLLSTAKK